MPPSLAWGAVVALSLGSWVGFDHRFPPIALAPALCAVAALALRRAPARRVTAVLICAVTAGWWGASARSAAHVPLAAIAERVPRCVMDARLVESITTRDSLLTTKAARCAGHIAEEEGLVVAQGIHADAGSDVELEGWLLPLKDDPFDRLPDALGAAARVEVIAWRLSEAPRGIHSLSARYRSSMRAVFGSQDGQADALMRGLTIGDTRGLDQATLDDFRASGLSHVLAVSGSNLAIVLGVVVVTLARASLRIRSVIAIVVMSWFVLVVGPEPSVLRAAAMACVGVVAMLVGNRASSGKALALAVIALLCMRPAMLISTGLHLSVAATAGMCLWARSIAVRLRPLPQVVAVGTGASLAAQIAVAPVLAWVFGTIPVVGPVANALALPAVGPATVLGLAAAGFEMVGHPVGRVLATAARPLAAWVLACAGVFASPSWAQLDVDRTGAVGIAAVVATTAVVTVTGRRYAGAMEADPKGPPSPARVLGVSLAGGLALGAVVGVIYAIAADRVLAHGLGTGWFVVGLIALALGLLGATEPPEGWRKNRARKSAASRLAVDSGVSEKPPSSWELVVWALVVGGGLVGLSMVAFHYAAG